MSGRDVVLCLVSDTFTDAQRRGFYSTADQTLLSLVASPRVRRILVVDHPRGVASQVKRRLAGDRAAPRSGKLRGVRPATIRTTNPHDVDALRRRYRAFDTQIALAARFHGLRDPAVVTFNLFHAAYGSHNWPGGSIFYAQDDESQIPRLLPWQSIIETAYDDAAHRHKIVAVTRELAGRIGSPESIVIPNGIDASMWRHMPPTSPSRTDDLVVAYAGTIDGRVDTNAFTALAAAGYSVKLAGPVPEQRLRDELAAVPGIDLLGTLTRDDVVHLLRSADVCVLAHTQSALTDAMSPLKFFEYRASGTPVVATDLKGIREAWPGGNLVAAGGDYEAAVAKAVGEGRLDEASRVHLVESYSWRHRHDVLLEML